MQASIRIGRAATASLAAIALTLPGIAAAQDKCPVVQAMLADDPAKLAGVGITITTKGLVDVTRNGAPDILRGAHDCDLSGPADGFDLSCNWRFEAGEDDQAKRAFDTLRRRLDACLPDRLEKREPVVYSPERLAELRAQYGQSFGESLQRNEDLENYTQTIRLDEDNELEVDIDLKRGKESGELTIRAWFYR